MERLSFVLPYYDNPCMLRLQYETWAGYPDDLKERIEIVVVDDGSPQSPAIDVPRPAELPALQIFRILIDKPWNQHGARNLGARKAGGPWLFLTDMDHVLPAESVARLMGHRDENRIYTFYRLRAPDMLPVLHRTTRRPKPHPNTFAMTQALYWKIGGYDEDYCGFHGTDSLFRERAFAVAPQVHLADVPIVAYTSKSVPDADTRNLPRAGRGTFAAKQRVLELKKAEDREDEIRTIAFPWERVL